MRYTITMSFVGGQSYRKIWEDKKDRDDFAELLSSAKWGKDIITTNKCGINLQHLCYYFLDDIE